MTANVKFLVVGADNGLSALILTGRSGENGLPQLFQRDIGDTGHPVGNVDIPLGAGGRFEHDRIRHDGGSHEARHFGRGHQTLFLIHIRNDGGRTAHRLIPDINRIVGLNIRQTVVVHDLQNVRLIQTGHRLGLFVVVHQNYPLAPGTQQMESGQGSHHVLIFIQNGVSPESAFQHGIAHVIDIIVQMEGNQIVALADALNGQRMADQVDCPVRVIRRGDDAGIGVQLQQLPADLRLTDDDAGDPQLQCPLDHVRLIAADHDAVRRGKQQVFPSRRQGDGDLAGDLIPDLAALVEDLSLQNGEQVIDRHVLDRGIADSQHIVAGHVTGGKHTVKRTVLIGHRQYGDPVRLHHLPGPADGSGGRQGGRRIEVQVPDLRPNVVDQLRRLGTEFVQNGFRLIADLAQAGGAVLPLPQSVFQCGVGHGGYDGVGIRVAMAGNVNFVHSTAPFGSFLNSVSLMIMRVRREIVNSAFHQMDQAKA